MNWSEVDTAAAVRSLDPGQEPALRASMCLVDISNRRPIGLHRPALAPALEVQFYAFDILVSDGEDVRKLPLSMRKTNLARLLARATAMRK